MLATSLSLARRGDRFERVLDEPLRTADGARNIEAAIEAPEILSGFERLLERGLREAQRRGETLELAGIYVRHGRTIMRLDSRPCPWTHSS